VEVCKPKLMAELNNPVMYISFYFVCTQSLGRRRLAIKLLEEESSCALQVPLLLSLATRQTKKGGEIWQGVAVARALVWCASA